MVIFTPFGGLQISSEPSGKFQMKIELLPIDINRGFSLDRFLFLQKKYTNDTNH